MQYKHDAEMIFVSELWQIEPCAQRNGCKRQLLVVCKLEQNDLHVEVCYRYVKIYTCMFITTLPQLF